MDQNPYGQKKLEERNQWLSDQGKITTEEKREVQDKHWKIYVEIKSWAAIGIAAVALIKSFLS